jgi:hypothetical protein
MIEFYKLCWPGFLSELLAFIPTMERLAMVVSSQGFMIFDNAWRSEVFEHGTPFLRNGALPAGIAVELQCVIAHHLRPAPDAAALSCGNCGRQHRGGVPQLRVILQALVRASRAPPAPRPFF